MDATFHSQYGKVRRILSPKSGSRSICSKSARKTGVNINSENNICVEVNERIVSGNKCFFGKLLKFKLSSRKSKILYGTKVTLDLSYHINLVVDQRQ